MEPDEIISVLSGWNYWNGKTIDSGIERTATSEIVKYLGEREVITLSGPRRAGKSTLMLQLLDKIANKTQTLYVNFEETAFIPLLDINLLDIVYTAYRHKVNPDGKAYIFLDEIQKISGWEQWIRSMYDKKENVKFILSGSSSKLLSKEFGTLLTGRHVSFELLPLSFTEFLRFKGEKDAVSDNKAINYLEEYAKLGGFPEIVLKKDTEIKTKILQNYFEDILSRDVIERFRIRDPQILKQIAFFSLTNISKEFSYNNLRTVLNISIDTARDYLAYLEQAYLLFQNLYFSYSMKESMARNRKIYAIDAGLRNAVSKSFSKDTGRVMENIVFIELKRTGFETYYWRGAKEVDFIIKKDNSVIAINVCLSNEIPEREVEGIVECSKKLKIKRGIILTYNYESERKLDGLEIKYLPLWKWLLSRKD